MKRTGFTLVELLVVMALMAMLAALMIGFIPNAASSARESRAGTQLQSWLNIAKQRALRDQAPRGLRLNVAATGVPIGSATIANAVIDCQYLEVPDDLPTSVGPTTERVPPMPLLVGGYNPSNALHIGGIDLQNGYSTNAADQPNWTVQPGDTIELLGTGLMYRITAVGIQPIDPLTGLPAIDSLTGQPFIRRDYIGITPALPPWALVRNTTHFRIVRGPRPTGDEILKMPEGTLIDIATNVAFGNPLPPSDRFAVPPRFYDILFAPSGAVISPGVASDKIHLWVRAPNPDDGVNGTDPFRGDPTLISTFVRTGFVGAYPPAHNATPYMLVR